MLCPLPLPTHHPMKKEDKLLYQIRLAIRRKYASVG